MDPLTQIALAERLARATGTAHALVDVDGVIQVMPVIECLGMCVLEIVKPPEVRP